MSNTKTTPKKKSRIGKVLLWILAILAALHIYTDGESTDDLLHLLNLDDLLSSYSEPQTSSSPYLGVEVQNTYNQSGAFVLDVDSGSPAEASGILIGDTITSIGQYSITGAADIETSLASFLPGDTTRITVLRGDSQIVLDVTLGETVTYLGDDDLPSVPLELRDHVYLDMRNWGYCEKLTGNVVITFLFVSDPEAAWTNDRMEAMKADLQSAITRITTDAAAYGAQVHISPIYKTCTTSETIVNGDTSKWMDSALTNSGLPDRNDINTHLESIYNCDSAPVVFLANHGGRATATHHVSKNEFAVLYEDAHAFYHELNHIYGAEDFYYPAEVKTLAESYFENSIMVSSSDGVMDDLTAYLVGWTDSLSDNALEFLRQTAYLTDSALAEARKTETYTGYVTDHTTSSGTYTGYMVKGVHHGQGKWTSTQGHVFEGNFVYGALEGYGTCRYADGCIYEGNWSKGTWHGQGNVTWANGDKYTGNFKSGKRHDYGVYSYADGSVYAGNWSEGSQHGQGKMTYSTGNYYEGTWVNGERTGKGTFCWVNGDKYVGDFAGGQRHGYGIYYYASGNRYEGNWHNGERHGQGTYYYTDGTVLSGTWNNGKYQN